MFAEPEWPEGQVDYKLVGDVEDTDDDEMDFKWLTVPNGQLTFDVEGNDHEDPAKNAHRWFSRKVHWPGGASGVTIGRGYDLGQQSNPDADLAAAGIGEPLFSWLVGAKGFKGHKAKTYLSEGSAEIKNTFITRKQQSLLFIPIYERMKSEVIRISAAAFNVSEYGTVVWEDTLGKIQDIVIDLKFRGDYDVDSRKLIQKFIALNNKKGLLGELSKKENWSNVPEDRFNKRIEYLE